MLRYPSTLLTCLLVFTLAACQSNCSLAPSAETMDSPIVQDLKRQANGTSFNHSIYDALLEKHVNYENGRVDYKGLKKAEHKLDTYLDKLADANLTKLNRDSTKALLLNSYNAYTLKLIVEHYPDVESIRQLSDPWGTKRYEVGGYTLSLDNIEHNLIRPIYKDPRIHFAVNCASIGCPPLADFAYTGDKIDNQLETATERTLQDENYARLEGDTLYVTRIMKWYGSDFTRKDFEHTEKTLPTFVSKYVSDEMAEQIEAKDPGVDFLDYDWALNDLKR